MKANTLHIFSNEEDIIITLALEALLDESKSISILKEEFLRDVLRLVEACFTN
jgi:hypothetical protein